MMNRKISFRQKRKEAPAWIFRWGTTGEPVWPKLVALALVGAGFSLAYAGVRIRMAGAGSERVMSQRATWILEPLEQPGETRLSWLAMQDGPFPSRLDRSEWQSGANSLVGSIGPEWAIPKYEPQIKDSPVVAAPVAKKLATGGETVFPQQEKPPRMSTMAVTSPGAVLKPVVKPLSSGAIPVSPLPQWNLPVDPKWHGIGARFLLKADPAGHVMEVISMADLVDPSANTSLANWLKSCRFPPDASRNEERWLSLMVTFEISQPLRPDGSHP